jgi:hypothetical protein
MAADLAAVGAQGSDVILDGSQTLGASVTAPARYCGDGGGYAVGQLPWLARDKALWMALMMSFGFRAVR